MSPEQAEPSPLEVDTRSDIYSLGVLLYELLIGSTPLDRMRLKTTSYIEVLRLIREEEITRPSARLSTIDNLAVIASNRSLEPRKLHGLIRGDLDWIVMKALEKDRNRRYETPGGLAQDIERYLAGDAVQACPPSRLYRLRKFSQQDGARGGRSVRGSNSARVRGRRRKRGMGHARFRKPAAPLSCTRRNWLGRNRSDGRPKRSGQNPSEPLDGGSVSLSARNTRLQTARDFLNSNGIV